MSPPPPPPTLHSPAQISEGEYRKVLDYLGRHKAQHSFNKVGPPFLQHLVNYQMYKYIYPQVLKKTSQNSLLQLLKQGVW